MQGGNIFNKFADETWEYLYKLADAGWKYLYKLADAGWEIKLKKLLDVGCFIKREFNVHDMIFYK